MSDQPPSQKPQPHVWFYQKTTLLNVVDEGPFTDAQMLQQANDGNLALNTPVRSPTRTKNQWIPAERVPSLAAAISEAVAEAAARKKQLADEKRQRKQKTEKPVPVASPVPELDALAPSDNDPLFGEMPQASAPLHQSYLPPPNTFQTSGSLLKPTTTSESRYPNLHRYLGILRFVVSFAFAITIVIAAGFAILTTIGFFMELDRGSKLPDSFSFFLTLFWAFCIFGMGYLYYIIGMALIEFVKVVIDIENNTRRA